MMDRTDEKPRLGRSQKLRLSAKGSEAVAAYATVIAGAQVGTGRAQFDAARQAWSAPRGLTSEDGLFLGEFEFGNKTLAEATRGLEGSGLSARELKATGERLVACGMLEPVPAPVAPPAPPPRRYW